MSTAYQRALPLKRTPQGITVEDVADRLLAQHGPRLGQAVLISIAQGYARRQAILRSASHHLRQQRAAQRQRPEAA